MARRGAATRPARGSHDGAPLPTFWSGCAALRETLASTGLAIDRSGSYLPITLETSGHHGRHPTGTRRSGVSAAGASRVLAPQDDSSRDHAYGDPGDHHAESCPRGEGV